MPRLLSRLAAGALLALVLADPVAAVRRRAFATSVTGTGNLASWPDAGGQTGLAAGDAICRARAAAAGLPNANAYRAWLSTASTDAFCHVRGLTGKRATGCAGGPPQAAGPWWLPNGITPVSDALDRLTDPHGVLYRPFVHDEFGNAPATPADDPYWTGTRPSGENYPDFNCAGWVSADAGHSAVRGSRSGTAQLWTLGAANSCSAQHRLLCLEPGASEAPPEAWTGAGNLVFLSSQQGTGDLSSWPQAQGQTGLAAGDAICRGLAAAAHLPAPDSFVAWLSDSGSDARDRVTATGPFRRVDGYIVANSRADLLDGSTDNSIHVDERGRYKTGGAGGQALTATLDDGTAAATACLDWTSSAPAEEVLYGQASRAFDGEWTAYSSTSCSFSTHLYCFSNLTALFWDGFEATADTSRWSSTIP